MKFVKISMLALTLGLFVTSCGNESTETEVTTVDTAAAPEVVEVPVATEVAPITDSAAVEAGTATATTADTTHAAH